MSSKEVLVAVDAIAFVETLLKKWSGVESVWWMRGERDVEIKEATSLQFTLSRYAMNGNGGYVGYEYYTGVLPLFKKSDFQVTCGAPYLISPFFILPNRLYVHKVVPAAEEHKFTKQEAYQYLEDRNALPRGFSKLSADELKQEAFDHGMGEGGYCPPDDDYAYQELKAAVDYCVKHLLEWKFSNPEDICGLDASRNIYGKRTWTCGLAEYDLDVELENSKESL